MLVIGLGMGLAMTPSTEAITVSLPLERLGVASALNDTTREFGSALGVALLGAVLASGYRMPSLHTCRRFPTMSRAPRVEGSVARSALLPRRPSRQGR
jgi:hypothetical protein